MATHRLDPSPDTVTTVFSAKLRPALTIDPGDTLVVRTLDAGGHLERQRTPGEDRPRLFPGRGGHRLAGPIAVRGALPGGMLAIRLVALRPDEWGWTVAGGHDTVLNQRLGVAGRTPSWLLWELDAERAVGRNDREFSLDLAPFLGVIGMPPAEPGEHSTIPPRACGGNIDCRELVAGSTLYLPVSVAEALLCVGDGHAAQGDGEVGGTAIECGMTTELVVDVVHDRPIRTAHAHTPAGSVTFGFSADLNEATAQALDAMLEWMQALFVVDKQTALALASTAVDMRVTQVANQVWGVHALLPTGRLRAS
jgi:acetamidase/formamidase